VLNPVLRKRTGRPVVLPKRMMPRQEQETV
jgi:hypothetical protein